MNYFDLHSDTLLEITRSGETFFHNNRMVELTNLPFEHYTQVLAVFSYPKIAADNAYAMFWRCLDHLKAQADSLPENFHSILSVENASLIGDRLERIDALANAGVRLMNPVWAGDNLLGGAWDTHHGLTEFGREAILRIYQNKIVPDLSHASDELAKEILQIAAKKALPVMASHSCARSVHPHGRNLPDDFFREIMASGGVVGLSFCPPHLTNGECNMDTILHHLEHYLALGGEDHLAIGADWDGIDTTPHGVSTIHDIPALADYLREKGWSEHLLQKIFYQNAADFFDRASRIL